MLSKALLIALGTAVIAGCATQTAPTVSTAPAGARVPPNTPGIPSAPGKHLIYRDATGVALRQFDYPNEDFCRRVEQIAAGAARCEPGSIGAQMQARATLRYNPPGAVVEAHYADLARCRAETGQLGPGVELVTGCTPK